MNHLKVTDFTCTQVFKVCILSLSKKLYHVSAHNNIFCDVMCKHAICVYETAGAINWDLTL
jgi:hypothetical protein